MDTNTLVVIASIITATVAIIPGVAALIAQSKNDARKAKIDMTTAAQNAAIAMLEPLQKEVSRLQCRVLELEQSLIAKTNEIGQLMQNGIDKDTKIRQLQYNLEGMQMRLDAFETKKVSAARQSRSHEDAFVAIKDADLAEATAKKEEIARTVEQEVQRLTSSSVAHLENMDRQEG
jgi:hypothetical protein